MGGLGEVVGRGEVFLFSLQHGLVHFFLFGRLSIGEKLFPGIESCPSSSKTFYFPSAIEIECLNIGIDDFHDAEFICIMLIFIYNPVSDNFVLVSDSGPQGGSEDIIG